MQVRRVPARVGMKTTSSRQYKPLIVKFYHTRRIWNVEVLVDGVARRTLASPTVNVRTL